MSFQRASVSKMGSVAPTDPLPPPPPLHGYALAHTDISNNNEQLTICLRWIDNLEANEDFVGF